ncbi:MAG: murein L,D-transpeptidase catalytic domain family protein [Hydrotalea sp.]|nr:murein L,D-transpeptidase catalytic domain family protein [Hydrotalea sp.]
MRKKIRHSVVFGLLSLSFHHAKLTNEKAPDRGEVVATKSSSIDDTYTSFGLHELGISMRAFELAWNAYHKAIEHNWVSNSKYLTIIDFSLPSSAKRWVTLNVETKDVLVHSLVAHGKNSGKEIANRFSNKPNSHQSSLGLFITEEPYQGAHGKSLRLKGVEKGINDLAYKRAIVVHGAKYVSESWIDNQGYLGRSHGCPALPEELNSWVVDYIQGGSCLYIYAPYTAYQQKSRFVK